MWKERHGERKKQINNTNNISKYNHTIIYTANNYTPLTFSRFEIHSVCYNVLQLHQFQLDRVYAAESTGRNLVGDEQEGEERRPRAEAGTADVVLRGWSPCRAPADQLPSAAPGHHQGRSVPLHRGPRTTGRTPTSCWTAWSTQLEFEVRGCPAWVPPFRADTVGTTYRVELEFVGPLCRSKADVSRAPRNICIASTQTSYTKPDFSLVTLYLDFLDPR